MSLSTVLAVAILLWPMNSLAAGTAKTTDKICVLQGGKHRCFQAKDVDFD